MSHVMSAIMLFFARDGCDSKITIKGPNLLSLSVKYLLLDSHVCCSKEFGSKPRAHKTTFFAGCSFKGRSHL
jgi:hypothetical protein